jgi:hypothetical protein
MPVPEKRILELRPVRHPDLAWRSWDGEVVILAPAGHDPTAPEGQQDGAEHDLNEVGSRIWELCDGKTSVAEIALFIEDEFEVDRETARADTADFVEGLLAQKLLLEGEQPK